MTPVELSTIAGFISGFGVAVFITHEIIVPAMRRAAVKANAGHYHPDTGKFYFGPFKAENYNH